MRSNDIELAKLPQCAIDGPLTASGHQREPIERRIAALRAIVVMIGEREQHELRVR